MADNIIELGTDIGTTDEDIARVSSGLETLSQKLVKFTAVTVKYDEEAEQARITLRGFNSAGNAVTTVLDKLVDGYKTVSSSIREVTKATKDMSDGQKEAIRAAKQLEAENRRIQNQAARQAERETKREELKSTRAKELAENQSKQALNQVRQGAVANRNADVNASAALALRPALQDTLRGKADAGIASKQELRNFNAPVEAILNRVAGGSLPADKLNQLFSRFKAGSNDFTAKEREIIELFKAATNAANEFGSASVNAANRAARAQSRSNQSGIAQLAQAKAKAEQAATQQSNQAQLQGAAQAAVSGIFGGATANAAPKQIVAFNSALQQAYNLLKNNQVTLQQFIATASSVKAGNIQTGLIGPMNQLQNAFVRANGALQNLGTAGANAGNKIIISWQNVLRLFETQVLFQAFSALRAGFKESVADAADFEKKIALVQTISQDANISFNEWAAGIRKVSDQLGSPITDVATASYDALSNQVTHAGETFGFVAQAIEFGRTTATSATDSINLFSSAINSFNLTSADADRVAKTFFATIDLGRVTGSELANSFGRAGVLADTLGLSLEELGAGISTLTRQGIKYNEAYTLLNNVNLKLIKPTTALQGLFKKLGYETGQDAIAALGFIGVLQALDDEFQGDTAKVAKYFDEIRGARGALNLTGKGLVEFASDLDKIKKAGKEFDVAKDIVANTSGQKFTQGLNELKNFFTVDIGTAFLHGIVNITQALGGVRGIIDTVTASLKIASAAAVTFVIANNITKLTAIGSILTVVGKNLTNLIALYRAGALASTLFNVAVSSTVLPFALAGIAGALAGIALAYTKASTTGPEIFQKIQEASKEADDAIIESAKNAQDKQHEGLVDSLEKSKQAYLQYTAEVRVVYNKVADDLIEAQDRIDEKVENSFGRLKTLVGRSVTEIDANARRAADNVTKAGESIKEAQNDLQKNVFEDKLKRAKTQNDPGLQKSLIESRIQQLRQVAANAFKSGSLTDAEKAYAEIDRLLSSIANQSQKIKVQGIIGTRQVRVNSPVIGSQGQNVPHLETRNRLGTVATVTAPLVAINTVEAQRNALVQERIALTKQFQDQQHEIANTAGREAENQARILAELEDEFKAIKEFSIFNKKGAIKEEFTGPEGQAKALKELQGHQAKVNELLTQAQVRVPERVATSQNFGEQRADLAKQFTEQNGALGNQLDNQKKLADIAAAEENIRKGADAAKKEMEGFRDAINASDSNLVKLKGNIRDLVTLLSGGLAKTISAADNPDTLDLKDRIVGGINALQQKASTAQTPEQVKALQGDLDKLIKTIQELQTFTNQDIFNKILSGANPSDPNSSAKTVINSLTSIKQLLGSVQREGENSRDLTDKLGRAKENLEALAKAANDVGISIKGINDQPAPGERLGEGVDATTKRFNALSEALSSVAAGLIRVNELKGSAPATSGKSRSVTPEENFFGGKIGHFSDGGSITDFLAGKFAKGSDRVPIMAARGEYIVNARQTRQFLPLLRAINSGQLSGAARGSSTTIGDINITVQGGSSSEHTVRSIGQGLRRELRRGTIKL